MGRYQIRRDGWGWGGVGRTPFLTSPLNQKFSATPKICLKLCSSSKISESSECQLQHRLMPKFAPPFFGPSYRAWIWCSAPKGLSINYIIFFRVPPCHQPIIRLEYPPPPPPIFDDVIYGQPLSMWLTPSRLHNAEMVFQVLSYYKSTTLLPAFHYIPYHF